MGEVNFELVRAIQYEAANRFSLAIGSLEQLGYVIRIWQETTFAVREVKPRHSLRGKRRPLELLVQKKGGTTHYSAVLLGSWVPYASVSIATTLFFETGIAVGCVRRR
jgi:hypothetical protein